MFRKAGAVGLRPLGSVSYIRYLASLVGAIQPMCFNKDKKIQ